MNKIHIKNKADIIRLRNIIANKIFRNSSRINCCIDYEHYQRRRKNLKIRELIDVKELLTTDISNGCAYLTKKALENRFDLLGSGWVYCTFRKEALGILGYRYPEGSGYQERDYDRQMSCYRKRRSLHRIDDGYERIAWNRDFKTGYIWDIDYIDEKLYLNSPRGVDIKTVWELGRMNYLIPMVLQASQCGACERTKILRHYKNIIADFFIYNPVGVGVQWVLAMEASIRISNILISYDIARQIDANLIFGDFDDLVVSTVVDHIIFIWNNIEKNITGGKNGNHYFSNIAGLIISCSYLTGGSWLKKIYTYAKKEFFHEIRVQFYESGGHFEGSTGYFTLVAEMALFTTAIFLRNGEVIPKGVSQIISSNLRFARELSKGNGHFFTFGDCDSGRYIKSNIYGESIRSKEAMDKYLNLKGYTQLYDEENYFREDVDTQESLIRYSEGLLGNNKTLEGTLILSLSGGKHLKMREASIEKNSDEGSKKSSSLVNIVYQYSNITEIKMPGLTRVDIYHNCEVGIWIFRSQYAAFFFYYGNNESGGHRHNDTLHFEYVINGNEYKTDCGTFCYTAFPDMRNCYRSQAAHNVPQYKWEQREYGGIFSYKTSDFREVVDSDENSIRVLYKTQNYQHEREIKIENKRVIVADYGTDDFTMPSGCAPSLSRAYGRLENMVMFNADL